MFTREYFKDHELKCPCCGVFKISTRALEMLYAARIVYGSIMTITSAYRCEKYNDELRTKGYKTAVTSAHLYGEAFDIDVSTSYKRFYIVKALMAVGFKRIKVYNTHIHVETGDAVALMM